ncbi:hypothetical protein SMKC081_31050 [Serratia marcescens]|nr:hypothetical protein C2M04_16155 [Serratia marcescens]BEN74960.1 hypothetical protein SMKC081_31050 [Serratia marcescens]
MNSLMHEERFERWLKVSIGLARFDPFVVNLVQSLGKMDANLCEMDVTLINKYKQGGNVSEDYDLIQGHLTHSYLWILGSYEVIRTLTQSIKENKSDDPVEVLEKFQDAKKRFARLRIPLAKFEAAKAHNKTDFKIAYPGFAYDIGIAWQVSDDVVISRQELSDLFLETLEFTRVKKLSRSLANDAPLPSS